jgi:hypothetical protein
MMLEGEAAMPRVDLHKAGRKEKYVKDIKE